ncbi:DUF2147 domain-containing protein [Bosea sp. ASV33]|uniref:DUF2147 domain-containing protein n=1 Tax=Bosea sp. ASV33 TaxID=2795106 RepID=UPI0018ECF717|nr:DUF2147 domain-containing protein [Bosea sp. ASV33]
MKGLRALSSEVDAGSRQKARKFLGLRSLVLAAALAAAMPAQADPMTQVVGRWRDSDGESEIAIARCGSALCGKIVWLKEPRVDRFNPNEGLRTRSLMGMQVLSGFAPDASGTLIGSGYNPADGKTYRTTLELSAPDALVVRGCVLGGLICDDDTWTRQP